MARPSAADAVSAGSLHAKYVGLQEQLDRSQFERPLYLVSAEAQDKVAGDIYARIDFPFESTGGALVSPRNWCDILILHINTKGCRVSIGNPGTVLNVWIGAKLEQALADAFRVDFVYRIDVQAADYLRVGLSANEGPMGTSDYRIVLEAIPLEDGRTFIHLAFSYGYGSFGRTAMRAYLATIGRSKVGFTVVAQPDGLRRHIGGMRGVVERNTMRYYAAIEAFLGALATAPQARFEKRIRDWYTAIELYPLQLHELEQGEYLDMKRREYTRQQAGAS